MFGVHRLGPLLGSYTLESRFRLQSNADELRPRVLGFWGWGVGFERGLEWISGL